MKNLLVGLVVLVALSVAVGFWQGWFKVEKTKDAEGKTHVGVVIDKEKYKKDKEVLAAKTSAKIKAWKEKAAELTKKAEGLTGDAKVKAQKEADELAKKHESLEKKLKEIEDAAEDKFEKLKKDLKPDLDDDKDSPK